MACEKIVAYLRSILNTLLHRRTLRCSETQVPERRSRKSHAQPLGDTVGERSALVTCVPKVNGRAHSTGDGDGSEKVNEGTEAHLQVEDGANGGANDGFYAVHCPWTAWSVDRRIVQAFRSRSSLYAESRT